MTLINDSEQHVGREADLRCECKWVNNSFQKRTLALNITELWDSHPWTMAVGSPIQYP